MRAGWGSVGGMVILLWGCRGGSDAREIDAASSASDAATPSADASDGGVRPPRVRGNLPARGRLPQEDIERVVHGGVGAFRACYEAALQTNPKLEGRLTVRFMIARNGSMPSATAAGDVSDATVRKCITDAFYTLTFPEPKGGIVTTTCVLALRRGENAATVDIDWPGR